MYQPPGNKVSKPWGQEIIWALTRNYAAKVLTIKQGEKLSLQYHRFKEETIMILSGTLRLRFLEKEFLLNPGDTWHIKPGDKHRMIGETDVQVLEVSSPELDDVVRLEDNYGRA